MSESTALSKDLRSDKERESRLARMVEIEDEVYEEAAGVVKAALSAHEVDPQQEEPPDAWVKELGPEAAMRKLRLAKIMWMKRAELPGFVEVAVKLHIGISRGRAHRGQSVGNQLNVKISLPAPTSAEHPGAQTYEVIDVDGP